MATLSGCLRSLLSKSNALHRVVGFSRLLPVSYVHTSRLLFDVAGQTIKMPSLSPTMTEGTIVRWLKKEGDTISPGDVLCEIQTDKAIVGFEVEEEGILAKIVVPDNSKDVKIGTVIGVMVDVGEDWKSAKISDSDRADPTPKTEDAKGTVPGIEIKMPSLSPTMTEGTIVKWLKQEGEKFEPGDALCEIQTDKAVVAFEVEEEGILAKILVPEDTKNVKLGTVIALMVNEGEDWKSVSMPAAASSKAAPAEAVTPAKASVAKTTESSEEVKLCGPSVRLLLQEYGIKHSIISRTGPHNALLKADVLNYITQNKLKAKEVDVPDVTVPVVPDITFVDKQNYIDIPHTSIRQVIARRLTESKTTICHAYMGTECMVDEVMKFRSQLKNEGVNVSVNDFVIKCVAGALRKVPDVNIVRVKDTAKICETVDISVAVATDKGLITPIVKQADILSIQEISECVKALAAKAREGRLRPEEFQGGSFSISNLGMFGITEFSAVINPPQGAILAIGTSRSVFRNKRAFTKMTVTLSFDNYLINETSAAEFLQCFKNLIENPVMMMVSTESKH